jgi:hypothetical protein
MIDLHELAGDLDLTRCGPLLATERISKASRTIGLGYLRWKIAFGGIIYADGAGSGDQTLANQLHCL